MVTDRYLTISRSPMCQRRGKLRYVAWLPATDQGLTGPTTGSGDTRQEQCTGWLLML